VLAIFDHQLNCFTMKLFLLFALVSFTACSGSKVVQTDLYFGQSKPDGTNVSVKDWEDFSAKYICSVFKEGSSVVNSNGNWYDTASKKIITEPSWLVISVNRMTPGLSKQIDSIGYWYKKKFDQQSVLRVDKRAKLLFL